MNFIAEICQNHKGDFDNVLKMTAAAIEAGATHVKLQNIYARNLVYRPQFENGYQVNGEIQVIKRPFNLEFERLKGLELKPRDCEKFVKYCIDNGVVPMTTCFTKGDILEIKSQGYQYIKVASYDCSSYSLLRELSKNFKYLVISTGASFDDEIIYTSKMLKSNNISFSFLHCVTIYPTALSDMNLKRMEWLRKYCDSVGFSDHSLVQRDGIMASKAAIILGAKWIERHFTIFDSSETKDGPISINPFQLKELVAFSKLSKEDQIESLTSELSGWREMIGVKNRELSPAELLNRDYYRGRFASPRSLGNHHHCNMIYNWEETPV